MELGDRSRSAETAKEEHGDGDGGAERERERETKQGLRGEKERKGGRGKGWEVANSGVGDPCKRFVPRDGALLLLNSRVSTCRW
jgi:hypothetical protein